MLISSTYTNMLTFWELCQ